VIITHAREAGVKIEDADLDRAVQSIALQNQLSLDQLRDRMKAEGVDFGRFRANLRDQLMVERIREREVYQRIRITDLEVDRLVDQQRAAAQADAELNVAQILVTVPEGASTAEREARRARAERRWPVCARARTSPPWRASCPKTATAPRAARSACAPRRACPTCSSTPCGRWRRARSRRPWSSAAPAFTC
jgi:hypothetical protein